MADTWNTRDLPVLRAAVEFYDEHGHSPMANELAQLTGFEEKDVQRALRALALEPFFDDVMYVASGDVIVGAPTGNALRVVGQWPTPEAQLDRLIAAIEAVAADEAQPEEERSKARQLGMSLKGALYQVAIGALGGAGGNIMSG
ncbi:MULTISPECIES: hypothetical protein [Tsukamurella]|nr:MULTISPECIES: hypothetical protein [Tsukamurella]NKY18175.1 hypothetical protein [Tsukamurella spumae]UEA84030.1 hypothetical protein LK411_04110 [Tsukamurella paurometabola]